ncbi:MAG: hypothetical protein GTN81_03520 [Proteobacteria bacterium]|nr:hypothetical protein [Pseudomonadota bacterium]
MKPTPFDPKSDIPPIPFDERHCERALSLKKSGLLWKPHVGCFVWDRDQLIKVDSPFPERIYFILNLGHFIRLLGSVDNIAERLVWLPTWHQARLLAIRLGVEERDISGIWSSPDEIVPGDELLELYGILLRALRKER